MNGNKLKVAFLTSNLSELRGGPILLFNYAKALNRYINNIEAEVIDFEKKDTKESNLAIIKKQKDAPKINIQYLDGNTTIENKFLRSIRYIKSCLQDLRYMHGLCDSLYTLHWRRGSGKYQPALEYFLHIISRVLKSFDVIYAGAWSSMYTLAYGLYKEKTKNNQISALHAIYHPSSHKHFLSKVFEMLGFRYIIPRYDFVSCSTPFEVNYLGRFGNKNVYFLPETVDDEYIKRVARACPQNNGRPFTGIFIGAKSFWKGYYHVIISFNLLAKKVGYNNVKLIEVGRDVPLDTPINLINEAKKAYLELKSNGCIESHKFVSESTKIKKISESDVIIIPSLAETISLVTIEGWFLSKPSIIADIPTARSIVKYNGNGAFFVKFGSVDEITKILLSMYKDRSLLDKVGKRGYLIAQNLFSMQNVAFRLNWILRKIRGGIA